MFNHNSGGRKSRKLGKFLFFLIAACVFVLVLGFVIMKLWNAVLPDLLGIRSITYWQATGLLILSRILFGGFGGHHRKWKGRTKRHWREKWSGMSTEEKAAFKARWKDRCRGRVESD